MVDMYVHLAYSLEGRDDCNYRFLQVKICSYQDMYLRFRSSIQYTLLQSKITGV